MSMEKDTCQKSGTSVIFQKEIKQCRECPHCLIAPDLMTGSMMMTRKHSVKSLRIN